MLKIRSLLFCLIAVACSSQFPVRKHKNIVVSTQSETQTLDPRVARDLKSATTLRLLYDGLFRIDHLDNIEYALAKSVEMSEDGKTYIFKLRDAKWSDGTPIKAADFIYSWKSMLDPDFPAPNAYQLFIIKGAKAAKLKEGSPDDIGLAAPDEKTLVVQLENAVPYFKQLLASYFFFPVQKEWGINEIDDKWIFSGPFVLDQWNRYSEMKVKKNPLYWDLHDVPIEGVSLQNLDENTALQLFESGEIDWIGSPLSSIPTEAYDSLKAAGKLQSEEAAATWWIRLNTEKTPFSNKKIRKALAYAINRKELIDHVTRGDEKIATSIVPPLFHLQDTLLFEDNAPQKAWYLFQEGLDDLDLSKDDFPVITLCYGSSDKSHRLAQAIQQQWKRVFDVPVVIQKCESNVLFDKLQRTDYTAAIGSWYADIPDPINFLEVFDRKNNTTNNTGWENDDYQKLLREASSESDQEKRYEYLAEAEQVLIEAMPVIPLFFPSYTYAKSPYVINIYLSELGYLDFKHADFISDSLYSY